MNNTMIHRGPDDSGIYVDDWFSLGHRRLSIIDLSPNGRQPMTNEDDSVILIFNGEIYNFKELRFELESKGHKFKSNTDTEVIIHLYEEEGKECIKHLNGEFAFILIDKGKKDYLVARDRSGVKPLYVYRKDGIEYYASEIKALLKIAPKEIDYGSLNSYLKLRYYPGESTPFKNIFKIPIASRTYLGPEKNRNFQKELDNDLNIAISRRLFADVPVGIFLSGGVDSSLIAAISSKESVQKTFSVGYEDESFENELKQAKGISDYIGSEHKEIFIGENSIDILPKLLYHADEPIADPAAIPLWFLAKESKKSVSVVLSGDGADELFGGYEQYSIMLKLKKYTNFLTRMIAPSVRYIPNPLLNLKFKYTGELGPEGKKRFIDLVKNYGKSEAKDYQKIVGMFTEKELGEQNQGKLPFSYPESKSMLDNMQICDYHNFLQHLLLKVDKVTMAHSLEARVPYMDHKILELSRRFDPSLRKDKIILRRVALDYLPKKVALRKKQRFFTPIHHWIKKYNIIDCVKNTKIVPRETIEKAVTHYDQSPLYYGRQIWTIYTFEKWNEAFNI